MDFIGEARANCINEVARLVVAVTSGESIRDDRRVVGLAIHQPQHGEPTPTVVGHGNSSLPFLEDYSLVEELCRDRAQQCVDRQLLVERRPITPEQYLGLWRKSIEQSIPLEKLESSYGIRLVATLRGPLSALAGKESWSSNTPYPTFDRFRERYESQMQIKGDTFVLKLEIFNELAVRDALAGGSFLQQLRDDSLYTASLEAFGKGVHLMYQCMLLESSEVDHVVQN